MKKLLRFFVVGIIVLAFLAGTAIGRTTTTIEVVYNTVNITVNGQKIEADNILYNGVTYVPLRAVAEALNKEVGWDQDTMTASINDKPETATVTRVVDGDTLVVNYKGSEERVRLIGVDTPESVHPDVAKNLPEGKVASEYTKSKLEGKDIELEFDVQERDQYGRILAYVWVDGEMFNKTLLKEGYARVATYPPNVKYVNDFIKIQEEARKNNKGFWSNDTFNGEVVKDISNSVTPVKKEGNYVGSIDSDKYHNPTCRYAEIIKEDKQIWFDTVEEAEKAGYSACGVCKP
jgi:endonuclease YncB( thermonuclease family)